MISIGLAGALSPLLKVGDVVIADQVISGTRDTGAATNRWRVALAAKLPGAHQGPIAGSDAILRKCRSQGGAATTRTGALAVDMESQVAARFAAARNLPLAALRVISDDAAPCAAAGRAGGDEAGWRHRARAGCWGRCCDNPLQVPALIRTARASNKAFAELLRCRDLCGVGLAGPDL